MVKQLFTMNPIKVCTLLYHLTSSLLTKLQCILQTAKIVILYFHLTRVFAISKKEPEPKQQN